MNKVLFAALLTVVLAGCGTANTLTATTTASRMSAKDVLTAGDGLTTGEAAQATAIVKASQESSHPDYVRKVTDIKFTRTAMSTLVEFRATVVTTGFAGHEFTTVVTGVVDLKASKLLSVKNAA